MSLTLKDAEALASFETHAEAEVALFSLRDRQRKSLTTLELRHNIVLDQSPGSLRPHRYN